MSATDRPIIGVLGGMGPRATVDFLDKVVAITRATRDEDHVPMIVYQIPQIPPRVEAIMEGTDAPFAPMLLGLQRLALAGASVVVIPCNTAHHWYERLVAAQPLRILHIADAVRQDLESRSTGARVGILATRGTHHAGIYTGRLGERFEPPIAVDEETQVLVDRAIVAVKTADQAAALDAAREAIRRTLAQGARLVILACTELPIAIAGDPLESLCIDSSLALARATVIEAGAQLI